MSDKEFIKRIFEIGMVQRKFDFDYSIQKLKNYKIEILKTIHFNNCNYMILNIRSGRYQILAVKNQFGTISTFKHSLRDCINWIKLYSMMDDIITNSYIERMDVQLDDYITTKELPNTIELNFQEINRNILDSTRTQEILLNNRIATHSCYGLTGYNLYDKFIENNNLK